MHFLCNFQSLFTLFAYLETHIEAYSWSCVSGCVLAWILSIWIPHHRFLSLLSALIQKKVSLSLARTQSQILFLHCFLSHGIPPNGFTIKLPISGCNPSLYNIIHLLGFCQSMLLSKLILQNHQNQALEVLQHVSSIQKILLLCNLKYLIPSPRPTPLPSKC